tara:strand:- start:117 stop:1241 length:1125 start_codon:yes stop_codon:yes gene_type:complete
MTDLVRKKLLALLRVINFKIEKGFESGTYDWQEEYKAINDPDILKVLKSLSKKEKEYLFDILKAMTLLTSGNVETVRSPGKYHRPSAKDFKTIFSFNTMKILDILGINYSSSSPTRQDYELAKKLLPIIGSDYLTDADFFQNDSVANLARDALRAGDERLLGYKTTWRGLSGMDNKTVAAALRIGSSWDIQRGVSTSTDVGVSVDYAGMFAIEEASSDITAFVVQPITNVGVGAEKDKGPSSMLFKFLNPKGTGMIARRLSAYGSESETILSGKATIEGWSLQFMCHDSSLKTVNRNEDYKHITINSNNNKNNIIVRDKPIKQNYKVTNLTELDPKNAYRTARMTVSRGVIDVNGVQHKVMYNKFSLILQAKIS